MNINPSVGLMYAQTGFATRVASDATTAPEVALAMSRTIANEMAKLEQNQVQAPESSVEARVADNGEHESKHSRGNFETLERNASKSDKEEPQPSPDPLVGNLLNIKV